MRGDIVLSGFVLTADEWDGMDTVARAQLLRAGLRWLPTLTGPASTTTTATAPPPHSPSHPHARRDDELYEAYEVYEVSASQ